MFACDMPIRGWFLLHGMPQLEHIIQQTLNFTSINIMTLMIKFTLEYLEQHANFLEEWGLFFVLGKLGKIYRIET